MAETEVKFDLHGPSGLPEVAYSRTIYRIDLPRETRAALGGVLNNPVRLVVSVDHRDNLLNIEQGTYWYGKRYQGAMGKEDFENPTLMQHADRMDVYDWLIGWELAEWQRIGPEDSEVFATPKFFEFAAIVP